MAAPMIDQAIEHIRDLIVRGALEPGSKLPPEPELAAISAAPAAQYAKRSGRWSWLVCWTSVVVTGRT
jgi:DNA-binding transcriptional MocR family regulator